MWISKQRYEGEKRWNKIKLDEITRRLNKKTTDQAMLHKSFKDCVNTQKAQYLGTYFGQDIYVISGTEYEKFQLQTHK